MHMKLSLQLQSTSPNESSSVFAVFILISRTLTILPRGLLPESSLIDWDSQVAVPDIRNPDLGIGQPAHKNFPGGWYSMPFSSLSTSVSSITTWFRSRQTFPWVSAEF